ncbi:MAG TPA: tyrosine-type recombinase/integrase, partial [Rhodanobacteraceae bacterium]|nr:tyrosine-type recombinase/integrase [Rhodanobacteraceae bacterium]
MRIQLTKKVVAMAQPKDKPYELRDTKVKGLLLRVQPSGHKSWIVTWKHGKRRTLGEASHLTLDQARAHASQTIAEYIQKGLPSIAQPTAPKITLATFLSDHYAPWAKAELKCADKYIERLERVFRNALSKPLTEIDAAWIERWWASRLKETTRSGTLISKATAWRDLAGLKAVLSKALKWGLLTRNPFLGVRVKAAKPRSVVRFLSADEEKRLRDALSARDRTLAAARASANEWRRARRRPPYPEIPKGGYASPLTPVVLLAMNTGLRRNELLSLCWSDVNFDAKMLTVRRENAKSGRQCHIPLNVEALAVLKQWRSQMGKGGRVFG